MEDSTLNARPQLLVGPDVLHELVNKQCPSDHCAIDFLNDDRTRRRYTYQTLRDQSKTWAHHLIRHFERTSAGSRPTVPVLMPQGPELYITLLAILRAGGSFCTLSIDAPAERIKFIVKDVHARLLLTIESYRTKLTALDEVDVIALGFDEEDSHVDVKSVLPTVKSTDLAYVMYTSGSTGTPKGVGIPHGAVCQSLLAHERHIPRFSRFLQFAAPTFDVSVFEIFFPFLRGSTLVACDRYSLLDDLPGIMRLMDVDAAELTPTVAGTLLQTRAAVPQLKLLLTIGEMLTPHVINEFGAGEARDSILWGMYGPTECSIHCTLQPAFNSEDQVGNIGYPLDSVSAFIIAPVSATHHPETFKILPLGETGELAIGGHQLAVGYLNRQEQTSSAFINTENYGTVYRTGDKAKIRNDGRIECFGRLSSGQIKLRGQRVELGEIEQAALQASHCRTAVACVVSGVLVLFCLVYTEVSREQIIECCRRWLPEFMVPGDIVFVKDLPQLPSGKVDRNALEHRYIEQRRHMHIVESEEEENIDSVILECVLGHCQKVLGDHVGLSTPLVSAGVDSLNAIRLSSSLRSAGFKIGMTDVLEAENVKSLVLYLESSSKPISDEAVQQQSRAQATLHSFLGRGILSKNKNKVQDILPCTPLQEAMLSETAVDSVRYCNWVELEFTREHNIFAIRNAIERLIDESEVLRTGFYHDNELRSFVQVIWQPSVKPRITTVPSFDREYSLGTPQKLLQPLAVQICTTKSPPRVLLQLPHHIYDGWSLELMLQDLSSYLRGEAKAKRTQYSQVTKYLTMEDRTAEMEIASSFWCIELHGFRPRPLPTLCISDPGNRKACVSWRILSSTYPKARKAAQKMNISPQVYFQVALSCLIGAYIGSPEVTIGLVTSGRSLALSGIESTVGPCIATLPLRMQLGHSQEIQQVLSDVHTLNRRAVKHCLLPLRDIKKIANVPLGNTMFDVVFAWQQTTQTYEDLERLTVKQIKSADYLESKLMIEIEPSTEQITARATFDPNALSRSVVETLLLQIDSLSEFFMDCPNRQLNNITESLSQDCLSVVASRKAFIPLSLVPPLEQTVKNMAILIMRPQSDLLIPKGALGEIVFSPHQDSVLLAATRKLTTESQKLIRSGQYGRILGAGHVQVIGPIAEIESQSKEIEISHPPETANDTGNWTRGEKLVAAALAESLDIPVSIIKKALPFARYGLDSLIAISMSRILKRLTGYHVPVSLILQNPTTVALASRISKDPEEIEQRSKTRVHDLQNIFSKEIIDCISLQSRKKGLELAKILPCTPLQEAMLSAEISSTSITYVNRMLFQVQGDLGRLQHAWERVCERHEILRTCFVPTDDPRFTYAQVVLKNISAVWITEDTEEDLLPSRVEKHAQSFAKSIPDSTGPPLKFTSFITPTTTYMLFCCHHAIYDAEAMSIVLSDVQDIYNGLLLSSPISYELFLKDMVSTDMEGADEFWSRVLANFEPTAFPYLNGKSANWRKTKNMKAMVVVDLDVSLDEVTHGCKGSSVSLLSATQAAWAKMLQSILGEQDVCFGSVFSGRTTSSDDLDRLAAPCFNTLPIRADMSLNTQNIDLMRSLSNHNVEVLPYQLTPLRRIQSVIGVTGQQLFDTLFILQRPPKKLDDRIWKLIEDVGSMDFPLVGEVVPSPATGTVTLTVHYDTSYISDRDARVLAKVYTAALRSCITNPSASTVEFLGLCSGSLSISNPEPCILEQEEHRGLQSAFEDQARLCPTATALSFSWADKKFQTWTFDELNGIANSIAEALLRLNVRIGDAVPIHAPKSPMFYASVLGILKAGAAFTPIDPDLPPSRKQYMIDELGARIMICDTESPPGCPPEITCLTLSQPLKPSSHNPKVDGFHSGCLAYRLYTSGSTGKPKAVSMEHKSPMHTIESSKDIIPWDQNSRLLQYAATTFDMCYYDCFLAWSFGFCLYAAEQTLLLNSLIEVIEDNQITLLDLTPSVARILKPSFVPSVKYLYCIGEPMAQEIVDRWPGKCVNSYGPTEAAFCSTIQLMDKETSPAVIGKPFPSVSFYLYSPLGHFDVPILGAGELYLGGPQIAREYHANVDLTQRHFIQVDGQKLYKTGDLVRMLTDGTFEFIGRNDDQIKMRGLRIELEEITTVIEQAHPDIKSVTTQVLRTSEDNKGQLVSFIQPNISTVDQTSDAIIEAAKRSAKRQLPSYMVPSFFLSIENFPLSAAGKLDKKALSMILHRNIQQSSDKTENVERVWTPLQLELRKTLAALARTPLAKVSHDTSIYQLGLDSINAVQIASKLRKIGFNVLAEHVLRHPTCDSLSIFLEDHGGSKGYAKHHEGFDFRSFDGECRRSLRSSTRINTNDFVVIRPCTPLQNGLLAKFIQSDGELYLNRFTLLLDPQISVSQTREAWSTVCQNHEMLRVGFINLQVAGSQFCMVSYKETAVESNLRFFEGVSWSETNFREWQASCSNDILQSLHLPPWRIVAVETEGRVMVSMSILHALYDAQSFNAIMDSFAKTLQSQRLAPELPIEPVLSDIIQASKINEAAKSFWKNTRDRIFINRFPNLHPVQVSSSGKQVLVELASTTLTDLEHDCRHANITLQAAAQAAWARILAAYTGEQAVTFGVVLSGRSSHESEEAVFPCFTTVPITIRNHNSNRELLQVMMDTNVAVREHQFTPLSDIQRLTGYPNEPLFDTIFAYQKLSKISDVRYSWKLEVEEAKDDHAISIELEPNTENRLQYRLTYDASLLPDEQAAILIQQLDTVLTDLVKLPDGNADDSYKRNLHLYSITPAKNIVIPSSVQLLHQFVERSALEHPKRIALEFAIGFDETEPRSELWTYEDLDRLGNKIANMLVDRGTIPGNLIAICFDKCPEAYFSILGILKAGCAYVAIDPTAPAARKMFIYEDSGAQLFLSTRTLSQDFILDRPGTLINMDDTDLMSFSANAPSLSRSISPQDRSYCLYTSGTTGTPKGCELTHENAVQAMLAFQQLFSGHWDDASRWLQFASFHFDVSVLEQYWSWSVGIRVVSAPRDLIFEDLQGSIRKLGITHIDLTPSLARLIYPKDVPDLCRGVFITGGEQLRQDILDVWGPKGVIYNGYGPTEATIGCTMYPRVPANGKPSNIGPAFDNVGSFVLQPETDIPVFRGAIGELCVSGKLIGKGYLNQPDLTSEKFPTLNNFKERVYRTGDLVRILHDGTFDFLGRSDDQIKLRGQRLEIGEINSVIKQSVRQVEDVTTLVLKHERQQGEQLVSYIVIGKSLLSKGEPEVVSGASRIVSLVKEKCKNLLATYMVPTHIIPITSIPLSVNNKADGKRLREIYNGLSREVLQELSDTTDSKPFSSTERLILDAVDSIVSVNSDLASRDSSIFELGLDSITVISLSMKLKESGLRYVSPAIIMKNPTVGRLAMALRNTQFSNEESAVLEVVQLIAATHHKYKSLATNLLGVKTETIASIAPCTPLQQGMISRALRVDNKVYFNTFIFELAATTDINRLKTSWTSVYGDVEILRTRFMPTDDGYIQVVIENCSLPCIAVDIADDSNLVTALKSEARAWRDCNNDIIAKPFQITFATSSKRTIMAVHFFHAIYDGNSLSMVFERVVQEYRHYKTTTRGLSFKDMLPYGPLRKAPGAQDFFKTQYSNATPQQFKRQYKSLHTLNATVSSVFALDDRYEEVRKALRVTDQAIVQASWSAVLQKKLSDSITLGIVVSGRTLEYPDAELTIGPLFNTIPLHIQFDNTSTWAYVVERCHEFNMGVLPYQHTPLRDVLKWTGMNSDMTPFENLLVFQKERLQSIEWNRNDLWDLTVEDTEPDYPIALEVIQKQDGSLQATLAVRGEFIDSEEARELLDQFQAAVKSLVKSPQDLVSNTVGPFSSITKSVEVNVASDHGVSVSQTFNWTRESEALRSELAEMTGMSASTIQPSTSIFDVGLDSIDAISLSSRLRKRGWSLPVSAIMRHLTIEKISNHFLGTSHSKTDDLNSLETIKVKQEKLEKYMRSIRQGELIERVLPATPLQESMVAEMFASDFKRYFNHDLLKLSPKVDVDRLKTAWANIVQSSPILRTTFQVVESSDFDASYAQVIYSFVDLNWQECSTSDKDVDEIIADICFDAAFKGFNTSLLQLRLITVSQESYLLLSIAHALYDGWSLGVLHDRVNAAYNGNVIEDQHHDETVFEIVGSGALNNGDFWKEFLSDTNAAPFPRQRDPDNGGEEDTNRQEFQSALSLVIVREACKNLGVSLQTLSQTCWALVLASYTHSLDVTFGVVLSGRDSEVSNGSLFPTMNTVPVRSIIHGTCQDLLRYMQSNMAKIRPHQHFPLRKIQSVTGRRGEDFFNTLFIYQRRPERQGATAEPLYQSVGGKSDTEYPIAAEMEAADGKIWWRCACRNDYLDMEGADTLLQRLDHTLQILVSEPTSSVFHFSNNGISVCGLPSFNEQQLSQVEHIQSLAERTEVGIQEHWTEKEEVVRKTIARVAKVSEDDILRSTSVFQLGLDSISAIKVVSLLRSSGLKISVGDLLKAGSCIQIARMVSTSTEARKDMTGETMRDLETEYLALLRKKYYHKKDDVDTFLPATAGQTYMLVAWKKSEGYSFYPTFHYKLSGQVSLERLQAAWTALVDEQPMLRTTFLLYKDPTLDTPPFIQATLKKRPSLIRPGYLEKDFGQPFADLYADKSDDGWILSLKLHHALYDGVSLPLLLDRLIVLCHRPSVGPNLRSLMLDFTALPSIDGLLDQQKVFWKSYFQDLSVNRGLSTKSPLLLLQPRETPTNRFEVYRSQTIRHLDLRKVAQRHRITLQSILLAAYARVYATFDPTKPRLDGVTIGIYLANRFHPKMESLPSATIPSVNLVPIRVHSLMTESLIDSAIRVHQDLLEIGSFPNAATSLADIYNWTAVRVDTFVNFIRLPGAEPGDESGSLSHTEVGVDPVPPSPSNANDRTGNTASDTPITLTSLDAELREPRTCVTELTAAGRQSLSSFDRIESRYSDAYLHALDIEIAERGDKLDIGAFCPEGMMTLENLTQVVKELREVLGRAMD
ncbi:hypothetical protein EJ05DRAFT_259760 [Pseudovirgaria hyperparasitica]|uniref:Carrier domain-containing protein n=1 Tax=Pseudovirgaria hyperparasitica TaxID=470096 RepID=A0A6A6WH63_9PEZI|nr:uncharacterized protein EJ05DRAFT_259760 [Pseudovirgaria hyperparasitica]KAF2761326.1 hypothetical protein EJ05DRAFT_259760 [Pseudovirgaria hyperparasitica]